MSYNDPLNKVDPLGLSPTDCDINSGPPYYGACPSTKNFDVPRLPGYGKVVVNVFVENSHDGLFGVEGRGDGRSWNAFASPDDSRIHMELDYETGRGSVRANPSCFWPTNGPEDCRDARSWGGGTFDGKFGAPTNKIDVRTGGDGSMSVDLVARDTLFYLAPAFNACFDFSAPDEDGVISYGADVDGYPSVEAYQVHGGSVSATLQQSSGRSNGPVALLRPYCGGPSVDFVNVDNFERGLRRIGSWVNPFG